MGANLQILGFKDSIKTFEAARKDFAKRAEQDRYENGHSYSGSYGMLGELRIVQQLFDTVDDFEAFLENKGKNDGYVARIKVIRETNPLKAARTQVFNLNLAAQMARQGQIKNPGVHYGWMKGTAAQCQRILRQHEKAQTKYKALLAAQVQKSTKFRMIAGGWVSQ